MLGAACAAAGIRRSAKAQSIFGSGVIIFSSFIEALSGVDHGLRE
jgi:hypothetical protein